MVVKPKENPVEVTHMEKVNWTNQTLLYTEKKEALPAEMMLLEVEASAFMQPET